MGELLLCREPIGAMPYYIEGISLNVYSIEELCYYIANNVYLIDSDFMSEELCIWLEKELKLRNLAENLRDQLRSRGRLSVFVETILREVYYLTPAQIEDVVSIIRQMEEKSEFECDKMRADRLMEKEKYLSSIYAYKHLLGSDDAKDADPVVLGNIYHNLGTAYARMFLFENAADYYKQAYAKNHDFESLKELLFAYRCLHDESSFTNAALENGLDDNTMTEIKNELALVSRNESVRDFEEKLSNWSEQLNANNRGPFSEAVDSYLTDWKEEYRRICRI